MDRETWWTTVHGVTESQTSSHTMQDSAQKQGKTKLRLLLHANNMDEKEVRTK